MIGTYSNYSKFNETKWCIVVLEYDNKDWQTKKKNLNVKGKIVDSYKEFYMEQIVNVQC